MGLRHGSNWQCDRVMSAGLLLCVAWYYTIICGFYILYCPVMYLMFINHTLYRKVVDALFALWELYPVGLFQCCSVTELHHFGDYVDPDESTLIVMNHRTRVDWNYIWIALYHAAQDPNAGNHCICRESSNFDSSAQSSSFLDLGGRAKIKFVLKDEIKYGPGLGWIMQLNYFLYVKRNWREDEISVSQYVDYYKQLRCKCRLLLFPEGTDLSESNKRRSDQFASAHSLQQYEFVLHPRTTGWAFLCSKLRASGLASVYDATVAYDTPAQTEVDMLKGRLPRNVFIHFKRYSIERLPSEEADLRTWLNDRWQEKETSLRKFHNDGNFIDPATNKSPPYRAPRSMFLAKVAFIFWTIVDCVFIFALYTSVIFRFWVLYHTLLFIIVTWYFGGFHHIQYKLMNRIKKVM